MQTLERITKIIAVAFSLSWAVILFTEYWFYNPNYGQALGYFKYTGLLSVLIFLGAAISGGLVFARQKKWKVRVVNGLSIFGFLLLLDIITMSFFYDKMTIMKLTSQGLISHLVHLVRAASCIYLIYLVARVSGTVLLTVFPPRIAPEDAPIIQTAAGIMVITALLFVVGICQALYVFVVGPIFLVILGLNWRLSLQTIKTTLWQPIQLPSKLNALGVFSFVFLAAFLVFNFVQTLRPFPLGTDSINFYVNLPTLIDEYASLVAGFQIYNWSLFMSLGLVVFGRVDVVLGLSFFGAVLSLFALFRLGRKWLDINYALLCLLLFFSVPMAQFFTFMDLKIDLALLYYLLCTLLLLINWISPPSPGKADAKPLRTKATATKTKNSKQQKRKAPVSLVPGYALRAKAFLTKHLPTFLLTFKMPVLIGLFIGFAMGVKLTALLAFFALITAIWYKEGGFWLFCSGTFLIIGSALVLQLDGQSFLRQSHQYASVIQWILMAMGLGLAAYIFINQREKLLRALKVSVIVTVFFILPIVPWLGKNYLETKSFSSYALMNGKKSMPDISLKYLEEKWKEVYE